MRLLILSPFVPWPLDHGGRIRVFHLLRERARRHRVTLACLSTERAPQLGPLPELCEEVIVERRPARPALDLARFLAGRTAYNCVRYRSRGLRRRIAAAAARRPFDALQVELTMMWQFAGAVDVRRRVLSTHNIEHELARQLGERSRDPLRRRLYRIEARRMRRFEEEAWEAADVCVVVSGREREAIAARIRRPEKLLLVPNGVDLERFRYVEARPQDGPVLLLGGVEYTPNRDAAEWFLDEILPRLRARRPGVRALLLGRGTAALARGARGAGVECAEAVRDIRPYLAAASVLMVPLRLGAGTRIKLLEAMAAGVPVACTGLASEGLAVRSGEHCLVADSAEGLAEAAATLLAEPELAGRLTRAARQLVEASHSWSRVAARLEDEDVEASAGTPRAARSPR